MKSSFKNVCAHLRHPKATVIFMHGGKKSNKSIQCQFCGMGVNNFQKGRSMSRVKVIFFTENNLPSDWMILNRRMPSQGVRKLDANVSS